MSFGKSLKRLLNSRWKTLIIPKILINFPNYTENGFFVNLFLAVQKTFSEFILSSTCRASKFLEVSLNAPFVKY